MASAPKGFHFTEAFQPVDLNSPLWKLKQERSAEYNYIISVLDANPKDLSTLAASCLAGHDTSAGNADPVNFLAKCEMNNMKYSEMLTIAMNVLPMDCQITELLINLQNPYQPIEITQNLPDGRVEYELGTDFALEIVASGYPLPAYQWFKLNPDSNDWEYLPIKKWFLWLKNFASEDAGKYCCLALHGDPVFDPATGERLRGVYSATTEVAVKEGDIRVVTGPPQKVECVSGKTLKIAVEVDSAEPLKAEWRRNDEVIKGSGLTLEIEGVTANAGGMYACYVSNSKNTVSAGETEVVISDSATSDIEPPSDGSILIVKQPAYVIEGGKKKAGLGDRVSLSCAAVCRHRIKYEWQKQGISRDVVSDEPACATAVLPVCTGQAMEDRIEEDPEVACISKWMYQCCITCPSTGERLLAASVRIPISAYATGAHSLPSFKVALVICQEDYGSTDFHNLNAPKRDGALLVAKLREMDFEVLAFANLTLDEVRAAVELFASLINGSTYAVFYYNGHALGSGDDMYLAAVDSTLQPGVPVAQQLIWRGEIETRLDSCSSLLCVVIYDSCRDAPPDFLERALKRREAITYVSSMVVAYGTRDGMSSYEYSDVSVAQGLYMRHLLRHIDTDDSVSTLFERLTDTFAREEDPSITSKMKPEFKIATKQIMSLNAPLRSARPSPLRRLFFNAFRYEAAVAAAAAAGDETCFSNSFEYTLGVSAGADGRFEWVTGSNCRWEAKEDTPTGLRHFKAILKVVASPTSFCNESRLSMSFKAMNIEGDYSDSLVKFQVIGVNCHLEKKEGKIGDDHSIHALYPPSAKKSSAEFELKDGPLFTLPDDNLASVDADLGSCMIRGLQKVAEPVRLRLVMWVGDARRNDRGPEAVLCKGVLKLVLPIVTNCPRLKLSNRAMNP